MAATVLLIEDDPALLPIMAAAFRRAGFETWSARNGTVGAELFRAGRPDLVVTDIVMPGTEGLEVIIEMKRAARSTKVIAISGGGRRGGGDFLNWARHLGADAVMAKPFRPSALVATAKRLLERRNVAGDITDLDDAGLA